MSAAKRPPSLIFFGLIYGVANAGAIIAFIPLLVLILPLKAEQISPESKLQLLSLMLLCGAITASIANIAAGWVSDKIFARWNNRTPQIGGALLAVIFSYYLLAQAQTENSLIAAVIIFQFCLNFLFSPIGALLADKIPHASKGRIAAILNIGLPAATLVVAVLTQPFLADENQRLIAIAVVVILLIVPLLFVAHRFPDIAYDAPENTASLEPEHSSKNTLALVWIARFAVQFCAAVIFGYVLYYLQDILTKADNSSNDTADALLGKMTFAATPLAIIMGLSVGYVSDRLRVRKAFLLIAACVIALALFLLVFWPLKATAIAGFIAFSVALTAYLTIDAALVSELLAGSQARATTLGVMNLTNTLPAALAPGLALILSTSNLTQSEFGPLLYTAAVMAIIAVISISRIGANAERSANG